VFRGPEKIRIRRRTMSVIPVHKTSLMWREIPVDELTHGQAVEALKTIAILFNERRYCVPPITEIDLEWAEGIVRKTGTSELGK
jgi:hypothetical protein